MKILITARELEVLRKAVYGLSHKEIAAELKMAPSDVENCLKGLLRSTQSKEPMQCMQSLARQGFQIAD